MTFAEFYQAFDASVSKLTPLWGNQQLDLSDFRKAGGKLLTWFGLADGYIPPPGMLRYRNSVVEKLGGAEAVDEFYRLFLAPGAGHCFGGHGPVSNNPLEALVSWVENGTAPEVLAASSINSDGVKVTRDLCHYPQKLVYQEGDVNQASSFSCQQTIDVNEDIGLKTRFRNLYRFRLALLHIHMDDWVVWEED